MRCRPLTSPPRWTAPCFRTTLAQGAIQTTNLDDLNTTAEAIGSGQLLSPESYANMVTTDLRGKTTAITGCATCFDQSVGYSYGLGIVTSGNWVLQDPLFLPGVRGRCLPAVAEGRHCGGRDLSTRAFDVTTGQYSNVADQLWRQIGAVVAPTDPPPIKKQ